MKDADSEFEITPELVLRAYGAGVFPMADSAEADSVYWVDPRQRGILPLDGFHLSRSLRKRLLRGDYSIRIDTAFDAVLDGCADRPETWINPMIRDMFSALFRLGHAHSVEVWSDGDLVGGLYGLSLGGAFFGESMFSRARDGSKIALAHLVARLRKGGYSLLDTQFTTAHLESLGAHTVPRGTYHLMLDRALTQPANFYSLAADASPVSVVQLITQTS